MPRYLSILRLVSLLTIISPISAAKYGYIESKDCVDPSGYEECYTSGDAARNDCISKNCKNKNRDCISACDCAFNTWVIGCALTHCWNKVYSCEYQNTVLELGGNCVNEKFEGIPFFPAPDDAPDACSCNLGKVATSLNRAVEELDTCIERNQDTWDSLSIDEQAVFIKACKCCTSSGILSSFWDICPNTKPSLLGADEYWNLLISKDEDYPQCGDYNDVYSCAKDLKFTPPGKDKSAKFYGPGELPKNGTDTLTNMEGTITSPLSGATFTWTDGPIEHPITAASVDAKPTGSSDKKDNKDDDKTDEANETGKEDEEDAASIITPPVWALVCLVIALLP
ncbi:uncharacterized protein B0J16DRAFT_363226 [Fusarium flagelliforme]|uniref:uncharacterized protein n=1 Tax=Fusarium flagelliforme TaxID=2675880 RepID=UPI001E8D5F1C|nr:uncharacterized protein B0J16DRAFT_363226 [Fusarium flagelliforme]KAH7186266.1 hypothetical protein B0J16DRAFT_363226 [Fusarium flagelliforme]